MNDEHQCIFKLNLPVEFVAPNFIDNGKFQELKISSNLLNTEFNQWLDNLGLSICSNSSRFFSRPPNHPGSIHVDAFDRAATKLNFVYDSYKCKMNWYELLPNKTSKEIVNSRNEKIRAFYKEDCRVIHTTLVDGTCLLNAQIPHQVIIGENQGKFRKCYSLNLIDKTTKTKLNWNHAMKIFNSFILVNSESE